MYLACPASISFSSSYLQGRPSINLLLGLIKLLLLKLLLLLLVILQKQVFALNLFFVTELNESLANGHNESGSPTDDDFQPAKKRFRTQGNQVNYNRKRTMAGFILLEIIPNGFYNFFFFFLKKTYELLMLFECMVPVIIKLA